MSAGLDEIAAWKIDANHKANERYFYQPSVLSSIYSGDAVLIVGRKGSGKTAIALHLINSAGPTTFAAYLDFRELRSAVAEISSITRPDGINPWVTIWRAILGHQVVKLMSQNEALQHSASQAVRKFVATSPLSRTAVERFRPTKVSTNIKVPYFEVTRVREGDSRLDDSMWSPIHQHSNKLIGLYGSGAKYYLVVDCVGDDVQTLSKEYEQIVIGLIKAAIAMRIESSEAGVEVFPCIFLRDDIHQELIDPDASKWSDYAAQLRWGEHTLREMLAHRLNTAFGRRMSPVGGRFKDAWRLVSNCGSLPQQGERVDVFHWIWRRTHSRPRDFVRYMRIAAKHALAANSRFIRASDFESAAKIYSEEFRDEILHEMTATVPNAKQILNLLQQIGISDIAYDDFLHRYSMATTGRVDVPNGVDVVKALYRYNVIGCQKAGAQDQSRFRYTHSGSEFAEGRTMRIHSGLCKGLMIY